MNDPKYHKIMNTNDDVFTNCSQWNFLTYMHMIRFRLRAIQVSYWSKSYTNLVGKLKFVGSKVILSGGKDLNLTKHISNELFYLFTPK